MNKTMIRQFDPDAPRSAIGLSMARGAGLRGSHELRIQQPSRATVVHRSPANRQGLSTSRADVHTARRHFGSGNSAEGLLMKRLVSFCAGLFCLILTACGPATQQFTTETRQFQASLTPHEIPPPEEPEISEHFGSLWIEWRRPIELPIFTRAYVYRSQTNDFSTAEQIAETIITFHLDRTADLDVIYYYWIRYENRQTDEFSDPASVAYIPPGAEEDIIEPDEVEPEPEPETLAFPWDESEGGYSPERSYLLAEEAMQAPIYNDGKYLFVGIDQGRENLEKIGTSSSFSEDSSSCGTGGCYRIKVSSKSSGEVDEEDNWTLQYGEIQETRWLNGIEQGSTSYFNNTAQLARDDSPIVMRFEEVPVVRFGGVVTSEDVARLTTVLQIINSAMPDGWDLEMATGVPEPKSEDLAGSIYVEFLSKAAYQAADDHSSLGTANVFYSTADAEISHAHVRINRTYASDGETKAAVVLAHELIHSLGIGHSVRGMESMMTPAPPSSEDLPLSILHRDDRRALHILYSDVSAGDLVSSLGPWSDTVMHLAANGSDVAFGVAQVDGFGEPWAYGLRPEMNLANNPELSGEVAWEGLLLGFTSDDIPFSGKTELGVNLDDLTGTIDFTDMETWSEGSLPGTSGTGTPWATGDVAYDVLVTGNTFRQIGGDEGRVTGAFFGEEHEAMGGVLDRTDLQGAFGGNRL